MNVSNDTNLLPRGCPVAPLKNVSGTIVTPKKVDRYTRAGFYGREIICPECSNVATVYHFSWSALSCQGCGAMVEKNQWTIK